MNTRTVLSVSLFLLVSLAFSQTVSATYKIKDLLQRIHPKDSVYVLNFWATWCKPCIQELPSLDSLNLRSKNSNIKVLLVCLDFKEELHAKVNPYLKKKNIQSECILLDEVNGNDFINQISESWTGAIPATYFQFGNKKHLIEKKLVLKDLEENLQKLRPE